MASRDVWWSMATTRPRQRLPASQVLFGAIVVLVGLLLLLETTDTYPTGGLLAYVPSLFVLVGLWAFVRSGFRSVLGPSFLVIVAGAWQLVALDLVTVDRLVAYWPVLLIVVGLSLVFGRYRSRARGSDADHSSLFAAFGGVERRNTSQSFASADLTALFGGVELDLRDAAIAEPPARINAVALFGGAEIVVPREWNVQLDVLPVLGGAADDRARSEGVHEAVDLVVTGFCAFGGVSVTD